ncbi:MAG: beta-lactamase family protein, partial [Actinobacteria bacterium]|nr:beta-lactamase family protein [Actinomycetota bacterium]
MANTGTPLDAAAVAKLVGSIRTDVDRGLYDGAVVTMAHRGVVVLDEAIGYAERDTDRPARTDDVFRILSLSKAFTVSTVFQAIEDGLLSFTTRVVDVIPEFRSPDRFLNKRKDRISLYHLLTHRSAMPPTPEPLPTLELGTLSKVIARICELDAIGEPGETIDYSPAINHALMAEMVRRVRGEERFRTVVTRDVLEPLGMSSTALGAPARLADRIVPIKARFADSGWLSGKDIEDLNVTVDEESELPWVGYVSSAGDVLRFAEMYRRGGELDGARVLHPAILTRAFQNQTGDLLNNWWIPMWQ